MSRPWFLNPHASDEAKAKAILAYYLQGTLTDAMKDCKRDGDASEVSA